MRLVPGSERIVAGSDSDPLVGTVSWAPTKSLWIGSITAAGVLLGPFYIAWDAFALFIVTSGITLCAGHSVGMHRRLIHCGFDCPVWLEYFCVYLGVLVGMAGPIGMIRLHDMRDWAQRQPACHAFFGHRANFWRDSWHQLHCELKLAKPPGFRLEPRIEQDRFYAWLERSWMAQQLPWAALFFVIGGMPWVIWGVCARIAVCVTGHWLVGHYAHRQGEQIWIVDGASVQGHNVRIAGLISMGESWHNDHHAFPGSAKLGLEPGQIDLGWALILVLERIGFAWNIVTPDRLPQRPALKRVGRKELSLNSDARQRAQN
ncbi:MAG: acyl-CoA desaturase [Novosphingobium sp.]|nr:acyl-CoA desaturase [Novosphingobium sp.]